MIAYLPRLYQDELLYSWFCRYYIHTGCLSNKMALEELFCKRSDNPNKEFIGNIKPEVRDLLDRLYNLEDLVLQHTMFPQYARFLSPEKKQYTLQVLTQSCCDIHHLFGSLPHNKADAFLKYCSLCVAEDRNLYGETYWHRTHQLRGISVCPKHGCKLISSNISVISERCYTLDSAELSVKEQTVDYVENRQLLQYCQYTTSVFTSRMNFESNVPISAILYDAMERRGYVKKTGKSRYTKKLTDDITMLLSNIGVKDISSMYTIQRVLIGQGFDFSTVCQIAFFLGISINELIEPCISLTQIEREKGTHYMTDKPKINWSEYDAATVPLIEQAAYDIYYGTTGRPERVTEKAINRALGLPSHRLEMMPQCRNIMQKYTESYEKCWTRRIIWAYDKLTEERGKDNFFWSDIRSISGVRMHHINEITPLLFNYVSKKKANDIIRIISFRKTAPRK